MERNIRRYYEIKRAIITISHEAFNKAIRYKAFNNNSDKFITADRKKEMQDEQQKFIVAIRSEMNPNGAYKELAAYQNKKVTIIPTDEDINTYLLIFFDKEVDDRRLKVLLDSQANLFYLEEMID
jgi:HSP90 family molecular chaperone